VGMEPFQQGTSSVDHVRMLMGFATLIRSGDAGRGCQVTTATVSTALTAIGQMVTLATGHNPIKLAGSDKLIPRLAQVLDGWQKHDSPTSKKLPVEADVPEYLCRLGASPHATALECAVGDVTVIAFITCYKWASTRAKAPGIIRCKLYNSRWRMLHSSDCTTVASNNSLVTHLMMRS
jgi:hypothetical protein